MKTKFITIILTFCGFLWILFYLHIWFFITNDFMYLVIKVMVITIFIAQLCHLFRFVSHKMLLNILTLYKSIIVGCFKNPLQAFFNNIVKNIPGIGDILMFFLQGLITIYNIFGKKAIRYFCILFFVIPKITIMCIIILKIFIFDHVSLYLLLMIPLYRLFFIIFWILNDFAFFNKTDLEKYLLIRKENKQILFDLNLKTVNNPSQKTLNLYAARYMLFTDAYRYTKSTILFENTYIKPKLQPLMIGGFFISGLKTSLLLLSVSINSLLYILIFSFVAYKEYLNILKENQNYD